MRTMKRSPGRMSRVRAAENERGRGAGLDGFERREQADLGFDFGRAGVE